jgi:Mrp family chromosome partitioning ATPase
MSRIFDALRKGKVGKSTPTPAVPGTPHPPGSQPVSPFAAAFPAPVPHPAAPPVSPPPAPVRPAAASGYPASAVARAMEPRSEPTPRWHQAVESLDTIPHLPEDVQRQMNALRVGIESAIGERSPRVVLLLASHPGEGTSTVAVQLAVTLAHDARQRVLLVDLNVVRPSLGTGPGWLAALMPNSTRFVRGSEDESGVQLDVLPVPDEARQAGLFVPAMAREMIESMAPRYDWILLDSPPALETPEAASLGTLADGVVVVIQAGRTKQPVVTRTVDLLRKAGARILGTVLNRRRLEIPGFIYRRL